MRKTSKPTDVFLEPRHPNQLEVVDVKFEFALFHDTWIYNAPEDKWTTTRTINLMDAIDTSDAVMFNAAHKDDPKFHGEIVKLIYECIGSVDVGINCKNRIIMDETSMAINVRQDKELIKTLAIFDYADRAGGFYINDALRMSSPDGTKNGFASYATSGWPEKTFLDDLVMTVTLRIKMDKIKEALKDALSHPENPYAIFGVSYDSNSGKPRIRTVDSHDLWLDQHSVSGAVRVNVPSFAI